MFNDPKGLDIIVGALDDVEGLGHLLQFFADIPVESHHAGGNVYVLQVPRDRGRDDLIVTPAIDGGAYVGIDGSEDLPTMTDSFGETVSLIHSMSA